MKELVASLLVAREQLDAAIAFLTAPPTTGCPHTREVNGHSFGEAPYKVCLDCGAKRPGSVA